MSEIALQCTCGNVKGMAHNISPKSGNRVVCYCKDCQAFANFLKRGDEIMNEYGGTDIFQMPLTYVEITSGMNEVRCMRLTPKGMHRWYTECCKTPIGNSLTMDVPFIGLITTFVNDQSVLDSTLGPVRVHWLTKSANGALPKSYLSRFPFLKILQTFPMMLSWKLKGLNKPSSFFTDDGVPISKPRILSDI